jgi:hypothetical protein
MSPDGMRLDLNPQVFLNMPTAASPSTGKYRAIVDYVPKTARRNEEEIELASGVTIKLKAGSKLKLENVSPAQWVTANSLILADIVQKESPHSDVRSLVLDYLSYTAKIGELANRYTWASVMIYDDDYRDKQARLGFRWGCDSSHLTTVSLEERSFKRQPANNKGNKAFKVVKPKDRSCNYYNEGKCFHGDKCKFPHTCSTCGKAHPAIEHQDIGGKQLGKTSNTGGSDFKSE